MGQGAVNIIDREARNVPFFIDTYFYYSIATKDYSPYVDPSFSTVVEERAEDKGFLVMPWSDGLIYGITLYDFLNNNKSFTGLTPQKYYASAYQWIPVRFIKVYSPSDSTYKSVATEINVGYTI